MAKKKTTLRDPLTGAPLESFVEFGAADLRDRLALFKHILVRRAFRKDLASYHVTVKPGGHCTVAATDMENRLLLTLEPLNYLGSGVVMIDAHALNAMLGAYAEPRVRIYLEEAKEVRVEGRQISMKLPGYDPRKELNLTAEGSLTSTGWLIRGDYLATAIEKTRFAADTDNSTRYAMSGIAICLPDEGKTDAEFVATDGRRLSLYRVPVRPHGGIPDRFWRPEVRHAATPTTYHPLIANKVVPLVLKLARETGSGTLGIAVIPGKPRDLKKHEYEAGQIQVVTRDAVLTAKIPDGRFPRFRDVWPTGERQAELRLDDASVLRDPLATVQAATDSEHKAVEMVLSGGCLMMTCESDVKGRAYTSLLVPDAVGKATFDLDALMFRQFLDAAGNERLHMRFFGKDQPLLMHAGPCHDFVLMPLTREKPTPAPKPEQNPALPQAATPDAHEGNGAAKTGGQTK